MLDPTSVPTESVDQTLAYLLGVLILAIAGTFTFAVKAWSQARGSNRAVNNIGPGEHRLLDRIGHLEDALANVADDLTAIMAQQKEFKDAGWDTALDERWDKGRTLNKFLLGIESKVGHAERKLESMAERLDETANTIRTHDQWERSVKHEEQEQ